MQDCIFCKVVKKELPSEKVYEDDKVLAFLDIHPASQGHTLVVPKEHAVNVYDIDENTLAYVYKIVQKIAIAVKKSLKPDGIKIMQANEPAGGQVVFHFHAHIIPKYNSKPKEVSLKDVAEKIKEKL